MPRNRSTEDLKRTIFLSVFILVLHGASEFSGIAADLLARIAGCMTEIRQRKTLNKNGLRDTTMELNTLREQGTDTGR